jgi:hypothetical protein
VAERRVPKSLARIHHPFTLTVITVSLQLSSALQGKKWRFCIYRRLNRWTAVHRLDVALLYRLELEKGSAGTRYHGLLTKKELHSEILLKS